ncbi:MAG: type IV secretion system DNA-binding domain-containing protein, partial [Chloroflexota bacterium]|nr:type IV secretion system DNA-binding domain-containing protein [Chloroflexota bacterium]
PAASPIPAPRTSAAPATADRHCLVLVDPHRDLAQAALGLVPPGRHGDVVSLDLADADRPFGLNLLDAGLGWSRDKAVSNALMAFRREFAAFWGPRMEAAFRFALLTLYEANEAICAAEPEGRRRQHTILQVPAVLGDAAWRQTVLPLVRDPVVRAWWSGYFDRLDRRLQTEVINPVATKVQRFAGSLQSRHVVGQGQSTIDPAGWLRAGAIVVVNTAKGVVGEDTAALVGGTLINLVGLAVGEQVALKPQQRRRVSVIVDEFHTMPGADYESILSELAKYGANLVLATQSLARLEALDREHHRGLRATLFANLDGLFAFHCSAEDARYLVQELGSRIDEEDLLELGEHRCYARLSSRGSRLPLFSVQLDPPPAPDPELAERLAADSAIRYSRARAAVERELAEALERIAQARGRPTALSGLDTGDRQRLTDRSELASATGDALDPAAVADQPGGTRRSPRGSAAAREPLGPTGSGARAPRNAHRSRRERGRGAGAGGGVEQADVDIRRERLPLEGDDDLLRLDERGEGLAGELLDREGVPETDGPSDGRAEDAVT